MYSTNTNLEFTTDPRDTQVFGGLGDTAFLLEDHDYLWNGHNWGTDPEKFETDEGLKEMFNVLAISYMQGEDDHRPFVAAIEGKKYPFYGTLFHPE